MKKLLLGTAAMIVFAAPALAADLPARTYTKAPAYTAPEVVYNWTGFYIGGHVGGAFGGSSLEGSDARFLGGVQGGFDYQFANNWVIGAEAQYSWLANSNNGGVLFPGSGTVVSSNSDQLGSVTGRLGYALGPALLYGKGGFAWRDNTNLNATIAGVPAAFTTSGASMLTPSERAGGATPAASVRSLSRWVLLTKPAGCKRFTAAW